MFSIIAAIGKKNEIGKKGQLVFNIKDDMKFFRETTTGHTVVMGYNTWKSLPTKLKNRTNVVVSKIPVSEADQTISDSEDYIAEHEHTSEEIFIIGGGTIYREFIPHATNIYLTEIDASDAEADTFFPSFDKSDYHKIIIKQGSEHGLNYSIFKYTKKGTK